MPHEVPRAPLRTRFRLAPLSTALALALHLGAVLAIEPFVIKDIRVEGLQRSDAGTVTMPRVPGARGSRDNTDPLHQVLATARRTK